MGGQSGDRGDTVGMGDTVEMGDMEGVGGEPLGSSRLLGKS